MSSPIPVVDVQHQAAVATAILKRLEGAMTRLVDEVRAAAAESVAELEQRVTDLGRQVMLLETRLTMVEDAGEQP